MHKNSRFLLWNQRIFQQITRCFFRQIKRERLRGLDTARMHSHSVRARSSSVNDGVDPVEIAACLRQRRTQAGPFRTAAASADSSHRRHGVIHKNCSRHSADYFLAKLPGITSLDIWLLASPPIRHAPLRADIILLDIQQAVITYRVLTGRQLFFQLRLSPCLPFCCQRTPAECLRFGKEGFALLLTPYLRCIENCSICLLARCNAYRLQQGFS